MKDQTAYARIARKIDEQDPHTAPRAKDGSIHEAFIKHLELVYSSEEAEVVQHLNVLDAFMSSQEVAEACGKDLEHVDKILAHVQAESGVIGLGNMYCLPIIPMLLNDLRFLGRIDEFEMLDEGFVNAPIFGPRGRMRILLIDLPCDAGVGCRFSHVLLSLTAGFTLG